MAQVLNVKADGSIEIQTGSNLFTHTDHLLSGDLQALIDQVTDSLNNLGASEIHVEKDTWRQFEHVVTAGEVTPNDFGTTVSEADFNQIMTLTDQLIADAEAAEQLSE
ncbi:MAG: hypothetical protein GWO10_09115 [candidate division Zixibacteria bacterium]|nr:hypothetical protein [Gammaproteobacteria bacterium]NIR25602.1 hypothetical protein [Gammaproteobacteria bacterium]NIR63912.1 hypothetical protein [candidate division Zixibacteria bacterium]NIS51290.1 hypothetical protein [Phycisphaerae bacterium]NIX01683.1 hypothetical protein [Phycisphaerae bacterium]